MTTRAPLIPPRIEVQVSWPEIEAHDRWDPGFYQRHFRRNERELRKLRSVRLGNFIPEELPDGSKGITYGQVGARHLDPRGGVRYLQVINIRDTGIDFAVKPDRVVEGSHNDPERSRVRPRDILFTNNAFRGTDTLIGRCVAVPFDYGRLNISQHIDRIRVVGINPFYVCCFLRSRFGSLQVQRVMHGVDAMTISFGRIRALSIPVLSEPLQTQTEMEYLAMSKCHNRAMAIKERLLRESGIEPGQFGESINELAANVPAYTRAITEAQARLKHLVGELEAVLEGRQRGLRPFPA